MEMIEEYRLEGDGYIPNSHLPLIIYRADDALLLPLDALKMRLRENQWLPDWLSRNGMYPRHHFHSDAHEFITVIEGEFTCRLGGEHGVSAHLRKGDSVIIPAGVAHRGDRITESLIILGAFPTGSGVHDFRLGYASEYARMTQRVRKVPLPAYDPLHGYGGPLVQRWKNES